ncbi:domain found in IF2B/IF5-domain-containing protein [Aspergillus ambiguus]|uniref:translation initiation factor eIF5 n=1 Tax=Aspergillus ambiguus TaxID=176160 RepID=UPI003CCD0D7E
MATVNIRRDVTDPFYRYKMEKLQSKIEGKGNGIKTVIVNLNSVAQSLSRPPAYVIKYFGFELGAQANAKPTDERWIINGAHDAPKLQDYLDGFISKFVLCKKCKNPETDVIIKDEKIILDCKACGQRSDVDPRLKLSTFILRNQAPTKGGKKDKGDKRARRERKKEKNDAATNGDKDGSPGDSNSDNGDGENGDVGLDAGSDDELTRRIKTEAQGIAADDDVDDGDWAVDVSEEAVKARAKELPSDLKRSLVLEDEDEGADGPSAYDELGSWIQKTASEKGGVTAVSDVDIYMKAKEYGIETKHKTLAVLAQTIFDEKIAKQIGGRAALLKKMVTSERHEKALLGGTERFVGKDHPELVSQVPAILLGYYQNDIISEETLKAWGTKASKKYVDISTSRKVRKAAEPFLEWLENAESEEESEEESDEE